MYLHPTPSICFGATTSSVPSTDYLNTLLIYSLSNQQHKYQFSSYFINLQVKYRVWMENMCTSCSCSEYTCSLKALFLNLGLFTLRYHRFNNIVHTPSHLNITYNRSCYIHSSTSSQQGLYYIMMTFLTCHKQRSCIGLVRNKDTEAQVYLIGEQV